jgi:hypothetical protein
MNTKTKLLISGFIALSLVLSFVALKRTPVTVVQSPDGTSQVVGAVSPYSPVPELNIGGGRLVGANVPLATGTSTVCAIQSPTSTSTLVSAGIKFTLASTSAVIVDLAKNTTKFSTTTKIGTTYGVAASAQATIVASSTGSVAGDATIFAPSNWFVVRMVGATVTTGGDVNNAPTGSCNALWLVQ